INSGGAFAYDGGTYILTGVLTGTYNATRSGTGTTWNIDITLSMSGAQIKAASPTDPCASTGTTRCFSISIVDITLTGTAVFTSVHPGPVGSMGQLSGTSTSLTASCIAPFSAMNSNNAVFTGLFGTLT